MKILFLQDSKQDYHAFMKDIFMFVKKLYDEGLPANELGLAFCPFYKMSPPKSSHLFSFTENEKSVSDW